ncbi:hypothetical protein [Fulvimarina endophytica]|nr:hypothetical protein [Fulvimarina endophytica]
MNGLIDSLISTMIFHPARVTSTGQKAGAEPVQVAKAEAAPSVPSVSVVDAIARRRAVEKFAAWQMDAVSGGAAGASPRPANDAGIAGAAAGSASMNADDAAMPARSEAKSAIARAEQETLRTVRFTAMTAEGVKAAYAENLEP